MAFERTVLRKALITGLSVVAAMGAMGLSSCASKNKAPVFQSQEDRPQSRFALFKRGPATPQTSGGGSVGGIGVNAYLWRASLDTLAFMPLSSADPYGGIIITDWYAPPEKPDERFKATIYILDTRLRADGLNVSINKQNRVGPDWRDAAAAPATEESIENAILTRARQLRTSGR